MSLSLHLLFFMFPKFSVPIIEHFPVSWLQGLSAKPNTAELLRKNSLITKERNQREKRKGT